jgi:hypothetical protein
VAPCNMRLYPMRGVLVGRRTDAAFEGDPSFMRQLRLRCLQPSGVKFPAIVKVLAEGRQGSWQACTCKLRFAA